VVERRHEDLRDELDRLAAELARHVAHPTAEVICASIVDTGLHDDSTIVAIYRDGVGDRD
jgi:hypothetical protein